MKTNEITKFLHFRTDIRIASYLKKHPKGLPRPSQDASRDPLLLFVPFGLLRDLRRSQILVLTRIYLRAKQEYFFKSLQLRNT